MHEATHLWERWQALVGAFAPVFTRPGWVRCVPWVTGMVRCWEAHTSTRILTALGLEARWRVLEPFAESGAWDRDTVERQTLRLIAQARPARWGRYHPVAVADTQRHRTSAKVWGPCTLHDSSAHSPSRAEMVRAHHWVVMGDLVSGTPWRSLPHAARLYGRKNQWPARTFGPRPPWPWRCGDRPTPSRWHRSWVFLMGPMRWKRSLPLVCIPVRDSGGSRS
jgi:hypothetical protein